MKLNIHLTKSTKRDHIYTLGLCMLEEHSCLILASLHVLKLKYIAPILENNNLSYTAQNQSSVTILKHLFIDGR